MPKPFTIARGFTLYEENNRIVYGTYHPNGEFIDEDCRGISFHYVEPTAVTFNTGFTDRNGNEIFTGDFIQWAPGLFQYLILFDEDAGCFGKCQVCTDFWTKFTRDDAKTLTIYDNIYNRIQARR